MTDRERRRIKYHGEAMAALQEAEEYVVVTLNSDEDGTETPQVFATRATLMPFFCDTIDRSYHDKYRGSDE